MGIDWDTWEHFDVADFELKTLSNTPLLVCSTGILDQVVLTRCSTLDYSLICICTLVTCSSFGI